MVPTFSGVMRKRSVSRIGGISWPEIRRAAASTANQAFSACEMATSNGALVETAVRLVRDVGRRPATVEEAREILSLGALR